MEYYLYISDSKLDMIFPQIPEKAKLKLAAEIGLNIGVLQAKLKADPGTHSEGNRIDRLKIVTQHITRSNPVGTVDEPASWIAGAHSARVVYLPENDQVVFFVGNSTRGARFGLGGSRAHLVSRNKPEKVDIGWSFLPDLLQSLRMMDTLSSKASLPSESTEGFIRETARNDEFEWMDLLRVAQRAASGPHIQIKFLAKTLLAATHPNDGIQGVLATPLYVAMAG
jgi:hypothetical protein